MQTNPTNNYDVAIIGGGPSGLSAALILGRGRKRVALLDHGAPRNAPAKAVQGFLTRDGTPPRDMRRIAWEQMRIYPDVHFYHQRVRALQSEAPGAGGPFRLDLENNAEANPGRDTLRARFVLLTVGVVDELPDLPGLRELWDGGESVFLCPYCHGWEARDLPWALLAENPEQVEWSFLLRGWSRDLIVFTNGSFSVPDPLQERLGRAKILLEERPIAGLLSDGDQNDAAGKRLKAIEFEDGTQSERRILFIRSRQRQTDLVQALNLQLNEMGYVDTDTSGQSSMPGVYAAGDLTTPMQQAVAGAAEGARVAAMINHRLNTENE